MDSIFPDWEKVINRDENHRLDFKQADKIEDPENIAQHLVAFANREGGRLIFGITDSKEVEGADIDEDESVRKISSAARLFCDPPVDFTHTYDNIEIDGRSGDILEIQISAYSESPHAVIDPASKISRSYYLRIGNESRPLTKNQEISQLFRKNVDPAKGDNFHFSAHLDPYDMRPINVRPKSHSTELIDIALSLLSDSDRDYLHQELEIDSEYPKLRMLTANGETPRIVNYLYEMCPFVLLASMSSLTGTIENARRVEDGERKLIDSVELISVSGFETDLNGEVLDELDVGVEDVRGLIGDRANILAPAGTNIVVECNSSGDGPPRKSQLVFEKYPSFRHVVGFHQPINSLTKGMSQRHPGFIVSGSNDKVGQLNFTTSISLNYIFPDSADPHIGIHSEFGDSLSEYVNSTSFEEFVDSTPHREIYRISEKMNEIHDHLDIGSE